MPKITTTEQARLTALKVISTKAVLTNTPKVLNESEVNELKALMGKEAEVFWKVY
jgi:hypothetical protein